MILEKPISNVAELEALGYVRRCTYCQDVILTLFSEIHTCKDLPLATTTNILDTI